MKDQLANTACGEQCEVACDLMTENRENCLSFCNLDDLCAEESGATVVGHETGSQSESGEYSGDNSDNESSTWSGFDYDYDEDDGSFESQIIENDETVGFNTQFDLDDEENLDDQATGSITASHFYEFTGSEWEASIEHLTYYEGNCTNERCHDGVMNSTQSDEWAIFNGHHPHDYTINKVCWLRKIFKFLADPLEYYVMDNI